MKKFTIVMAMLIWSTAYLHAQKLIVSAPTNIAGVLQFDKADGTDPANNWGSVEITSTYTNIPVEQVDDGTSDPTLGCNTLTNTTLAGKAALIDRGDCAFSIKAQNAQDKGAVIVIIVNNEPLGTIGMLGTAPSGPAVNIPVLMVNKSDGDMIKSELANGVTISLTPWSFGFDYDLAIEQGQQIKPFNLTQPYFLLEEASFLSNQEYYYTYKGATFFNNYSKDTLDTVAHQTAIYDGATVVYSQGSRVYYDSTNPLMPTTDTATTLPHPTGYEPDIYDVRVFRDSFDMTTLTPNKTYTLENIVDPISRDPSGADGYPLDNIATSKFTLTDSVYGKSTLNADGTLYMDDVVVPSTSSEWGPILHFPYIPSGNTKLYMDKVTVPVYLSMRANTDDLDGKKITINVYQWINTDGDSAIDHGELTSNLFASEVYTFPTGSIVDPATRTLTVDIPLYDIDSGDPGVEVDGEGVYWVSMTVDGTSTSNYGFAVDNSADNHDRQRLYVFSTWNTNPNSGLWVSGLYTDNFYSYYTNTGQVAMNVTLATREETDAITDVDESLALNIFPNPAEDFTNLEVKADGVQEFISYVMTDITGKVVGYETVKNVSENNFQLDVTSLPAGSYIIKVSTPEGFNTQKFVKN